MSGKFKKGSKNWSACFCQEIVQTDTTKSRYVARHEVHVTILVGLTIEKGTTKSSFIDKGRRIIIHD